MSYSKRIDRTCGKINIVMLLQSVLNEDDKEFQLDCQKEYSAFQNVMKGELTFL